MAGADPVTARRLRNYRAMHLLNQGDRRRRWPSSIGRCRRSDGCGDHAALVIDRPTAGRLSAESPGASRLRGQRGARPRRTRRKSSTARRCICAAPSCACRIAIAEAAAPFNQAHDQAGRDPRRPDRRRRSGCARRSTATWPASPRRAATRPRPSGCTSRVALLETNYPGSAALLSAKGRLAGYLCAHRAEPSRRSASIPRHRHGQCRQRRQLAGAARACSSPISRCWSRRATTRRPSPICSRRARSWSGPASPRPRRCSRASFRGGSDEAARLFRQSVNLTRDIERGRIELARLAGATEPTAADRRADRRAAGRRSASGSRTRSRPRRGSPISRATARFRAGRSQLADLQHLLRAGRGLLQDDRSSATTPMRCSRRPRSARAFRIGASPPSSTARSMRCARPSRSVEDGQQLTYPFDLELALQALPQLFGPVAGDIGRSPPSDLRARRGDAAAAAQSAGHGPTPGSTPIARAPRGPATTASISAAPVARPRPRHHHRRLGPRLPRRAPGAAEPRPRRISRASARTRRRAALLPAGGNRGGAAVGCTWPLAAWNRPISAEELVARGMPPRAAARRRRRSSPAPRSPTPRSRRGPISTNYRILHFATHGLVTPPAARMPGAAGAADQLRRRRLGRAADLRARFSTSSLDADLVILSACDTASRASAAATEEAGLASGGDSRSTGWCAPSSAPAAGW